MGLRDTLTGAVSGLLLEQPLKNKDMAEIAQELDLAGGRLIHTFAGAKDNPDNRRLLSHIVGMERWGQSRLRVALGEPLTMDEYDDYRPPREAPWPALQDAFSETRQQTVALVQPVGSGPGRQHQGAAQPVRPAQRAQLAALPGSARQSGGQEAEVVTKRTGVLLVNTGSPDSPDVPDVRRYLGQFLMDGRVLDQPWPLRKLIVSGFILPSRPKRSAEAYRAIWWPEGSPRLS